MLMSLLSNSLEHAICEEDAKNDESTLVSSEETSSTKTSGTIWNAKVFVWNCSILSIMRYFKLLFLVALVKS
jgi:hypothetical protein